jgi:hypothetical protein
MLGIRSRRSLVPAAGRVIGALLAGWFISPLVGIGTINSGLSIGSFLVSLLGAVVLLAIVNPSDAFWVIDPKQLEVMP